MERDYHYYAFISYSHKDQKWAEWIQREIEHYKLPAIIRKETRRPLPKKIAPVFRDATDLGVDVLVDGLHEELEKSRFLIVVCSPNSAKPNAEGKHFVDEEVRHFCELGREKQIIPVIIEGTPEESFGPVLKSKGILALDATKQVWERVRNDIVAKILGLKPDMLWRRAERERKKRLVIRSIMCGILGLIAVLIGSFAWDANRTVENYYADYVDSFGLPEGIFPLSRHDIKSRHAHYRFEYRGYGFGKSIHHDSSDWTVFKPFGFYRVLRRVVLANSKGTPATMDVNNAFLAPRPRIQDFIYEQMGINIGYRLSESHERNSDGKLLRRVVYTARHHGVINGLAGFFGIGEGRENMLFGYSTIGGMRSVIAEHELIRDSYGRVKQRRFLNAIGGVSSDSQGVCAIDYFALDRRGRIVKQCHLMRSANGNELVHRADRSGVSGQEFCFEEDGPNLKKMSYLGSDDKRVLGQRGWWAVEREFDKLGRNVHERFLGIKDEIVLDKSGYAERRIAYDDQGNAIAQDMFGVDGSPTFNSDGYAGVRICYDKFGRDIERLFVDTHGMPTFNNDGVAGVRKHYGCDGRLDMIENLGLEGEIVYDKKGNACVRYEYNVDGNLVRTSWLDPNHNPALCMNGYSCEVDTYDWKGRRMQVDFYGLRGERTVNELGVASIKKSYDDYGNVSAESYFGVNGEPAIHKYGYSTKHWEYDKRGYKTKEEYFGVNSERVVGLSDVAGYIYEYDAFGNCVKETRLGVDGTPVIGKNAGFAMECTEYNSIGQAIRCTYLDENGASTESWMGIAGLNRKYDENGRLIEECYFDKHGLPALHKFNGYRKHFEYNSLGRKVIEESFGGNGRLWANYKGVARIRREYNGHGKELKTEYFGDNGKLIRNTSNIAIMVNEYDAQSRLIMESFFDENGTAVLGRPYLAPFSYARRNLYYDERGRLVAERYFDCENKPLGSKSGVYAEKRTEYDERSQISAECYFDEDGKCARCDDDYCRVRYERDVRGNVTNQIFYAEDGNLKLCKYGYAQRRSTYGRGFHVVKEEHFGTKGERVACTRHDGESIKEIYYDHYNRIIGTKLLGVDGKPMIGRFGYAEERIRYDERGNKVRIEYYGTNAAPILALLKAAGKENVFDSVGNVIKERYFGVDGKLITNSLGYVEKRMQYADNRKITREEFFDASGKRCLGTLRVAGTQSEYDTVGNKIRETYIGIDGNRVACGEGYYEKRMTYYKFNQKASESYWGEHGEIVKVPRLDNRIGCLYLYDDQGKKYLTAYLSLNQDEVICMEAVVNDSSGNNVSFILKQGKVGLWHKEILFPEAVYDGIVHRFAREIRRTK